MPDIFAFFSDNLSVDTKRDDGRHACRLSGDKDIFLVTYGKSAENLAYNGINPNHQ